MIIKHRVNDIAALQETENRFGVEVDIQFLNGALVTGHDPGNAESYFTEWLTHYSHAFLALNIKQEGIESAVISACEKQGINDFFLFDLSFPALFNLQKRGERRIALRVSDMEAYQTINFFEGKVDWVWLDAFQSYSFIDEALPNLKNFKVCLVSPELHLHRDNSIVDAMRNEILKFDIEFSAICTKVPSQWEIKL
jgi:hypothetical protein